MSEFLQPEPPPVDAKRQPAKTVDQLFHFCGYYDAEPIGVCRVRLFTRAGAKEPPVVVLTELDENETTSATNLAENLWPEIIARFAPQRFDYPEPVIAIEHYPPVRNRRGHIERGCTYDQVTFTHWQPKVVFRHGLKRVELGEPDWHSLSREQVISLIGEDEVEPVEQWERRGT